MVRLQKDELTKLIIKFVILIILAQPFLNVSTYFTLENSVSIGQLMSAIFILVLLIYQIFIYNGEKKRRMLLYLVSIFLYFIFFLVFNVESNDIFVETINITKLFYLQIIIVIFYGLKEFDNSFLPLNILKYSGITYSIIIIISSIFKIGESAYIGDRVGSKGLFNSANEISIVLSICLAYIVIRMFSKIKIMDVVTFLLLITASLILGTKTPLLTLILSVIYCIFVVVKKFVVQKLYKKVFISLALVILFIISIISLVPKTNVYKNLLIYIDYIENSEKYGLISREEITSSPYIIVNEFVMSQRLSLASERYEDYKSQDIIGELTGFGYFPLRKDVEMDFVDIFLKLGLVGFAFYITSLIIIIKDYKFFGKLDLNIVFILYLTLVISLIVGHTITSPTVILYIAVLITNLHKK